MEPVLVAKIIKRGVFAWLGLNVLMTVSGIILPYVQAGCESMTIKKPAISALLLDPKAVTEGETRALRRRSFAEERC